MQCWTQRFCSPRKLGKMNPFWLICFNWFKPSCALATCFFGNLQHVAAALWIWQSNPVIAEDLNETQVHGIITHRIHEWYNLPLFTHSWLIFMVNVCKCRWTCHTWILWTMGINSQPQLVGFQPSTFVPCYMHFANATPLMDKTVWSRSHLDSWFVVSLKHVAECRSTWRFWPAFQTHRIHVRYIHLHLA